MKRDPNGSPNLKGDYPIIPPREGLEGIPEEREPWTNQRWADVLIVLAAIAGIVALVGFLMWWAGGAL